MITFFNEVQAPTSCTPCNAPSMADLFALKISTQTNVFKKSTFMKRTIETFKRSRFSIHVDQVIYIQNVSLESTIRSY